MSTSLLPIPLYTQDQARELDRRAIAQGTPASVLMERAGRAAFDLLRERWPAAKRLAVFCGGGNNGGDGYVLARLALEAEMETHLYSLVPADKLKGDARQMADKVLAMNNLHLVHDGDLPEVDLIVDALLGIGITGAVREETGRFVEWINHSGVPVFSLDLPSGLNGDTGMAAGPAVRATATLTFIAVKKGLLTGQGPAMSGQLFYDDLQVPEELFASIPASVQRLDKSALPGFMPPRSRDAHKGHFGHVLLVGGDHGFGGAIIMAAQAALRCGAGLVTVATRADHVAPLLSRQPEIMVRAVNDETDIMPLVDRASVLVIGPGLGQADWGRVLLKAVLASDKPQVLDADALNLLAQGTDWQRHPQRVLTPHPGEAARLVDSSVTSIQTDRFASVTTLQQHYGGVVLLKGAGTLVAGDDRPLSLIANGNPGMATGGMGDILSGIIGGLLAQGAGAFDAARFGALIHALAAEIVTDGQGERGLGATDLLLHIPHLVNGHI
jgi:NAD(P)H-hydrate epimerase